MRTRHSLVILLLLLPLSVVAASAKPWLKPVPPAAGTWQQWAAIPADQFFEVPVSQLATAQSLLSVKPFRVQSQRDFAAFGHPGFWCRGATKPYLVRALFENGGTGGFALYLTKHGALVVGHASLGPGGTIQESAIMVCLSKQPVTVFSAVSSAM